MAYGRGRTQPRRARIEMIPLIDVMFLLLSFFIYVTIRMVPHGGIAVNLAAAETAQQMPKDRRLVYVSVAADGRAHLDQQAMPDAALASALAALRGRTPPVTVVLNADKRVSHERVVQVLDLTRRSGLTQVVFAVDAPASGAAR